MSHRAGNCIIHDVQTGIPKNYNVFLWNFHHISKQLLCFTYAVQNTVIAAVHSFLTDKVRVTVQDIHHSHREIQLFCRRFAPGHIQLQSLCLYLFKFSFQF